MWYFCYLSFLVFSELRRFVVRYLTLIWKNFQSLMLRRVFLFLPLFFSFWYTNFAKVTVSYSYSTVSWYSVLFCSTTFSLFFSCRSFHCNILKLRESLPTVSNLLMRPSKALFISVTVVVILAFIFYFFLEFQSLC